MKRRTGLWIAAALALGVAAIAWTTVARGGWVTGPHTLAWHGRDDKSIVVRDSYTTAPCTSMLDDALVLGDRLIIRCDRNAYLPAGWAWLEPKRGRAKLAWPLPRELDHAILTGIAARDASTFAVALRTERADDVVTAVGIAGPDGWLREPAVVTRTPATSGGFIGAALVVAMAWVRGELEIVMTHPRLTSDLDVDPYGSWQPPDVIRVPVTGEPVVMSRPNPEGAMVVGALPTARGWKIVLRAKAGESVSILDEDDRLAPAPPELAWWGEHEGGEGLDKVALGTLWGHTMPDSPVVERDGKKSPAPAPPLPGLVPVHAFGTFILVDGVLRSRRLYASTPIGAAALAREVGGRAIVIARSPHDEDLQLIGERPDALRPLLHNSTSDAFRAAAILPAGSGYHVVTGDSEYVTVDRDLRRTDDRSLWHHLRTRGSVGDFIDEPHHVVLMAWALFALPVLALIGWLAKRLATALAVYAISGGIALAMVAPLLAPAG